MQMIIYSAIFQKQGSTHWQTHESIKLAQNDLILKTRQMNTSSTEKWLFFRSLLPSLLLILANLRYKKMKEIRNFKKSR